MLALNWGVLSTAAIAINKVIPAMQTAEHCRVLGIASRSGKRAQSVAEQLGIPRSYDSYEALLADPDIDAVYVPLPNHLLVEWAIKAAEAGKHVLCEKPIALTADEARKLIAVRDRAGVYIQEAFMVRTNPQWLAVRKLVQDGVLGRLQAIQGFFSYHQMDTDNIRNIPEYGGGGLLDIGCYPINTVRYVLGDEPLRVAALINTDPTMGIDCLGSVMLDFAGVQASFTYGTQLMPYQTMNFFGDAGRLEVEIPFNPPNDEPCRILHYHAGRSEPEVLTFATSDQYGFAGTAFSWAILEGTVQPIPLEDTIANMQVIDACFRAGMAGSWETPSG